jgi:hypothetical protein
MIKELVLTGIGIFGLYKATDAQSIAILTELEATEVQSYSGIDLGKMSFDQYLEYGKDGFVSETGAQIPLTANLSIAGEYTGIEGIPDHKRIGLMGEVSVKGIDLMLRAMYDTEDKLHIRTQDVIPTKYGTLGYFLDMDKAGNSHQRFSYRTPDKLANFIGIPGLSGVVETRLTSGDGEGESYYVGLEIAK